MNISARTGVAASRLTAAVIICAFADDRWELTLNAVRSAIEQDEPPDEVLLVVDHNPQLAQRLMRSLSGVRVLESEEEPGLSGARNTGLDHTSCEIIAFLDDDAVADTGWLKSLRAVYQDEPTVVGVGGAVLPVWPGVKPHWFPGEFGWTLGCSYDGQPTQRHDVRNLLGSNMSARRSDEIALPRFSHGLGHVGRRPLGCEETQFFIELARAMPGSHIVYEPNITVRHTVHLQRTKVRYFIRRCWSEGLSKAVVAKTVGSGEALSIERTYVRTTLVAGIARRVHHAIRDHNLDDLAQAAAIVVGLFVTTCGYLAGVSRRHGRSEAR